MSTSRERLARLEEQDARLAARARKEPTLADKTAKRIEGKLAGFERSSAKNPAVTKGPDLKSRLAAKAQDATKAAGPVGRAEKKPSTKFKAPKTLAAAADALYTVRQARLAKEKEAAELQEEETFLKEHLITNLPKGEASGIAGRIARVTIGTKKTPRVNDWSKFYAHIVGDYNKHAKKKDGQQDGAFSLLNKAVGRAAVQERWDAGQAIPGVEVFNATDVSINKI